MPNKCPKCDSDQWKGAKLIILEGTTRTKSVLEGELVNKNLISGNVGDDFLSDKWFTKTGNINTTTSSALVDQVRTLLISEGSSRPIPLPPQEPAQIALPKMPQKPMPPKIEMPQKPRMPERMEPKWDYSIKEDPAKTRLPQKPKEPIDPVKDVEKYEPRSWLRNYLDSVVNTILFVIICFSVFQYFFSLEMSGVYKYLLITFDFVSSGTEGYEEVKAHISLSIPEFSLWVQSLDLSPKGRGMLGFGLLFLLLLCGTIVFRLPGSLKIEKRRKMKHQVKLSVAEVERDRHIAIYEAELQEFNREMDQRNRDIDEYNKAKEEYDKRLKEYNISFEEEIKRINADCELELNKANDKYEIELQKEDEKYSLELKDYEIKKEQINKLMEARNYKYFKEIDDYKAEVEQVKAFRRDIWERACMCTRCGTMYMGQMFI